MTWGVWAGEWGGSRFAKWIDVTAASQWLNVINSIVSRADNAALMSDGEVARELEAGRDRATEIRLYGAAQPMTDWWAAREAAQTARCVELAKAIRGFCLACDMDIFALGHYAGRRLAGDDGGADYAGMYLEFGAWRREAWALLRAQGGDLGAAAQRSDVLLDLFPRVDYAASGEVSERVDVIDPPSGADGSALVTSDPFGWKAWTGYRVKWWVPPAGAASDRAEVTVLLPLSVSWALLSAVGRSLVAARINGSLARSQAWVWARNARLSRVLGGEGLPATVVEASAAVDVAAIGGDGPFTPTTRALIGAVVAIVAAVNPAAGLVLGVLVGLGELLARILPRAVAFATDAWGRRLPFLEPFAKSGTLAPRAAPTHALVEVPALFRNLPPDPNPWAEGLLSSDPALNPGTPAPPPAAEGSGGGAVAAVGFAALLALLFR